MMVSCAAWLFTAKPRDSSGAYLRIIGENAIVRVKKISFSRTEALLKFLRYHWPGFPPQLRNPATDACVSDCWTVTTAFSVGYEHNTADRRHLLLPCFLESTYVRTKLSFDGEANKKHLHQCFEGQQRRGTSPARPTHNVSSTLQYSTAQYGAVSWEKKKHTCGNDEKVQTLTLGWSGCRVN